MFIEWILPYWVDLRAKKIFFYLKIYFDGARMQSGFYVVEKAPFVKKFVIFLLVDPHF